MIQTLHIGIFQLCITLVFILFTLICSVIYKLKLEKDLTIGTIRTVVQLFLMGYVLMFVFKIHLLWITLLIFLIMISSATHIIKGRIHEKRVPFVIPTFISMLVSYFIVSVIVTGVIVQAHPWWRPQYFIPLSGMVVGNSMNALAISLDRLFSDLKSNKDVVEMKLTLGANYQEASEDIVRNAIKAGMIPSVNSMMGVGVVFIPGMMTGQILAGTDPLLAIRYQIIVMLMLVASTALGSLIIISLVCRRCFGKGHQLLIQ